MGNFKSGQATSQRIQPKKLVNPKLVLPTLVFHAKKKKMAKTNKVFKVNAES